MPTRTTSRPSRASSAPLPKGARVPQPALLLWLARAPVIGDLALFFASPALMAWAVEHRSEPASADEQRGGLLFGSLLAQHHGTNAQAADQAEAADQDTDPIAPMLASATFALLTPRAVAGLGEFGIFGVALMLAEACLATAGMAGGSSCPTARSRSTMA